MSMVRIIAIQDYVSESKLLSLALKETTDIGFNINLYYISF